MHAFRVRMSRAAAVQQREAVEGKLQHAMAQLENVSKQVTSLQSQVDQLKTQQKDDPILRYGFAAFES